MCGTIGKSEFSTNNVIKTDAAPPILCTQSVSVLYGHTHLNVGDKPLSSGSHTFVQKLHFSDSIRDAAVGREVHQDIRLQPKGQWLAAKRNNNNRTTPAAADSDHKRSHVVVLLYRL